MRIFHIITHLDLGGAERVAANIAESDTPGMEYHIVEVVRGRSAYTRKFMSELAHAGVLCHRSLMPDIRFHFVFERVAALLFPLRLMWLLMRWRPDVVHVHTEAPDLCLYFSSRVLRRLLRGVRIVRTIHNTRLWAGQDRVARHVERYFVSCGANIAISQSVRDSYALRFGQVAPIIHNGVAAVSQRAYDGIVPGKTNILFAGRFEPQKGIPVLCEVVRALASDTRYHFTIAGGGSMEAMIQSQLGGLANVSIVPPIFGLSGCMSSFHYLFMPSEFEGLSMLSMEASMQGLPVIANRCPGLSDTLPSDWPLIVDGNSVASYLRLFRQVIPSASHDALASRARLFAGAHFSIRRMQERYEQVYISGRVSESAEPVD